MLRRIITSSSSAAAGVTAISSSFDRISGSSLGAATTTAFAVSSLRFGTNRSGPRAYKTDRMRRRQMRDETELDEVAQLFLEDQSKRKGESERYERGLRAAALRRVRMIKAMNESSLEDQNELPFQEENAMDVGDDDTTSTAGIDNPLSQQQQKTPSASEGSSSSSNNTAGVTREESLRRAAEAKHEVAAADVGAHLKYGETSSDYKAGGRERRVEAQLQQMRDRIAQGIGSDAAGTKHRLVPIVAALDRVKRQSLLQRRKRLPLQRQISAEGADTLEQQQQKALMERTQQQEEDDASLDDAADEQLRSMTAMVNHSESGDQSRNSSSGANQISSTSSSSGSSALYSSNPVVSDIGAKALDEIELARSGALAKRVRNRMPLPVYETDKELLGDFFLESSSAENDSGDAVAALAAAAKTLQVLRGDQLEKLARAHLAKRNTPVEVDEAMVFRRNANKAKAELRSQSDERMHIATNYQGDEFKELAALRAQSEKLEQQQQQQTHEQAEQKASKSTAAEEREEQRMQQDEEQKLKPGATWREETFFQRQLTELLAEGGVARVRRPDAERIARQHSPRKTCATELAAAASILPARRFTPSELEERSPTVLRRTELSHIDEQLHRDEKQTMSPLDAHVDISLEKRLRVMLMKYYVRYPINNMIQCAHVVISGIQAESGTMHHFDADEQPRMTLANARQIAAEHGKDLVQVWTMTDGKVMQRPQQVGGGGGDSELERINVGKAAVCRIMDHLGHAMETLQEQLHMSDKLYVGPSPLRPLLEVGYRGVAHDFAIRFKSVNVARFLYKRFPVRVILTKFGTAREGFPIFERVLAFIRMECERLGAFYIAGQVRYDSGSIWCYLHPTTAKMPLTQIESPSTTQLKETMEKAMFDSEYDREVQIPESLSGKRYMREANRYDRQRDHGTAWTFRAPGLTLQQQRRLKLGQGWIPKGNHELYQMRGDVDINAPFRTEAPTGIEKMLHPRETNLEQAERGAGVLARRAHMTVTELLDANELPSQPSLLGRLGYQMIGDQIDIGDMKQALGLKRNRKAVPPRLAPGFATLGQREADGIAGNIYRD